MSPYRLQRSVTRGFVIAQVVGRRLLPAKALVCTLGEFLVDKVSPGQVYIQVRLLCPGNVIPTLLHINSFIIWGMYSGHRDIVLSHRNCYSDTMTRHVPSQDQNNSRS